MAASTLSSDWLEIEETIKQENIIVIKPYSGPQHGYTIYSLAPESESNPNPAISQIDTAFLLESLKEYKLRFLPSYKHLPAFLRLPPDDIHVLVSTKSGTEKAVDFFEAVLKPVLKAVGLNERSYNVINTESHETITKFASGRLKQRAEEGTAQTVLLLSGDGGIVDVVNGLMRNGPRSSKFVRPTIVLFPLGTGNALFHSLHKPLSNTTSSPDPPKTADPTLALRTLLTGTSHPLPLFRATFSPSSRLLTDSSQRASPIPSSTLYGAIVASYGLHSTLVADSDTPSWRAHGSARFGLVARELLSPPGPHAYRARVTLQNAASSAEETLERQEHGYLLVTLVSNLEKTFTISPASEPLDGKLRVVHFGPEGAEMVGGIMGAAYQGGKHVGMQGVAYEEIDGARIEFLEKDGEESGDLEGRWRRVCVDGLIVRVEEGGWMEVAKVGEGDAAVDVAIIRQSGEEK